MVVYSWEHHLYMGHLYHGNGSHNQRVVYEPPNHCGQVSDPWSSRGPSSRACQTQATKARLDGSWKIPWKIPMKYGWIVAKPILASLDVGKLDSRFCWESTMVRPLSLSSCVVGTRSIIPNMQWSRSIPRFSKSDPSYGSFRHTSKRRSETSASW